MTDVIDLNRGVTVKMDPSSGARCYMYKDAPGVFLNAHGHEVADTFAARCGFDLKTLKKLRLKREALETASAEIEAAFETERESKKEGKVIKEEDGYKVVQHAFGRCWVIGPDGDKMHPKPLTKGEAVHLFGVLKAKPKGEPEAVEIAAKALSTGPEGAFSEPEGGQDGT